MNLAPTNQSGIFAPNSSSPPRPGILSTTARARSVPQGSTFLHHAHASLLADDWLQISGHYLYSFTPDDYLGSIIK